MPLTGTVVVVVGNVDGGADEGANNAGGGVAEDARVRASGDRRRATRP